MPCGKLTQGSQDPIVGDVILKTTWSNQGPQQTTYNDFFQSLDYKETVGVCTPRFHSRKRAGELIPYTPFFQCELKGGDVYRTYAYRYDDPNSDYWREYSLLQGSDCGFGPNQVYRITKDLLVDKLDQNQDDTKYFVQAAAAAIHSAGHDTLTFIAELRKTKEMFINIGNRLLKRIEEMKRGRARINPKHFANNWAEARYGLRPLFYDMEELYEVCRNLESERERWTKAKGATQKWSELEITEAPALPTCIHTLTTTLEWELGVKGIVAADITPSKFRFNLADTSWELVPWSFIVDKFVDVGQQIAAINFLLFNTDYTAAGGLMAKLRYVAHQEAGEWGEGYSGEIVTHQETTGYACRRIPMKVPISPQTKTRFDVDDMRDILSFLGSAKKPFSSRG